MVSAVSVKWHLSHVDVIWIFLMSNNIEYLFIKFLALSKFYFSMSSLSISNKAICLFIIGLSELFIYSRYHSLIKNMIYAYFTLLCDFSFHFLDSLLWSSFFKKLMKFNLPLLNCVCILGVIVKKPWLTWKSGRFTSMFFSEIFIVLDLTFRSLIHFELIFVCGVRKCSSFKNMENFMKLHVILAQGPC